MSGTEPRSVQEIFGQRIKKDCLETLEGLKKKFSPQKRKFAEYLLSLGPSKM